MTLEYILVIMVLSLEQTNGANRGQVGKEFYFSFPANDYVQERETCSKVTVDVSSSTYGELQLVVYLPPSDTITQNLTLNIGQTTFDLPCQLRRFDDFNEQRGVFIQTNVSVTIYATTYYQTAMIPVYVYPIESLGTTYTATIVLKFIIINYIAVLGTTDNTHLTFNITSLDDSQNVIDNQLVHGNIDRLQMIQRTDLKIFKIMLTSDHPVVFYVGRRFVLKSGSSTFVGQMRPITDMSESYIAPLKIISLTHELFSITCAYNLSEGFCIDHDSQPFPSDIVVQNNIITVLSANTINVIQHFVFPFQNMISVNPIDVQGLDHYMAEYAFVVPDGNGLGYTNLIAAIVLTKNKDFLILDGLPVTWNQTYDVPVPLDTYSLAVAFVSPGYHMLTSMDGSKFGLTVYGFNDVSIYGYLASMISFENRAEIVTVPVKGLLSLHCGDSVSPMASFTWQKLHSCDRSVPDLNDTLSLFNGIAFASLGSTYTVSSANFGDLGDYTCQASDVAGAVIHEYHVEFSGSSYGFKDRCSFDQNTFCGWIQIRIPNAFLQKGTVNSNTTGPDDDHTLQNGQGRYMYINTTSDVSESEMFVSSNLPARMDLCLSFWYYVHGGNVKLSVDIIDPCKINTPMNPRTNVFSVSGGTGKQWQKAEVGIVKNDVPNDYRLVFIFGGDGAAAIDDLQMTQQLCSGIATLTKHSLPTQRKRREERKSGQGPPLVG